MINKKESTLKLVMGYSILFAIVLYIIYLPFLDSGKTFVSNLDALSQHYVSIAQLKEMIKNVIHQPQEFGHFWDWTLGLGADSFQSFSYYSVGDIFVYPFLFFKNIENTYVAMMLSKLFFAGLALIAYLKNKYNYSNKALLLVSMFYVFTGYAVHSSISHPMFLTPLVIYPLLLMSIDYFLEGKNKAFFTVMVTWTLISNFYFAFLLGLGAIFYFVVQVLTQKEKNWKEKGIQIASIIPFGLLGILLSSVILLPTLDYFFNSTRSSVPFANGLLVYPFNYYLDFIPRFITATSSNSFEYYGGYGVVVVPALVISFSRFKKYKKLNLSIAVGFICWLTPMLAAAINGMATPSVRWVFLMTIPFTIVIANMIDSIKLVNRREVQTIFIVGAILTVMAFVGDTYSFYEQKAVGIPLVLMWITIGVIAFNVDNKDKKIQGSVIVLLSLTCINAAYLGNYYNSEEGNNAISWHMNRHSVDPYYKNYLGGLDQSVAFDKSDFYRSNFTKGMYDGHRSRANIGPMIDKPMVNSYVSLQNGSVGDFSLAMDNVEFQMAEPLKHLDNRYMMSDFLGVRYLYAQQGALIPNGFEKIESKGNKGLYETKNAFPLVYSMEQSIPQDKVKKMNGIEREELLSQAVVVEKGSNRNSNQVTSTLKNESVKVSKKQNNYELLFNSKSQDVQDKEFFIEINGIEISPKPFSERRFESKHRSLYEGENKIERKMSAIDYEQLGTTFNVKTDKKVLNSFYQFSPNNISSYRPTPNTIMSLGKLSQNDLQKLKIEINGNSIATIKDVKIYSRVISSEYSNRVEMIQKNKLKDMKIKSSSVTGEMTLEKSSMLATSIPYSKGWKLKVDGKSYDIQKVNYGFIGAKLPEGTHKIELYYQTPLFKLGLMVSIGALLILVGYVFFVILWKKRKQSK